MGTPLDFWDEPAMKEVVDEATGEKKMVPDADYAGPGAASPYVPKGEEGWRWGPDD